MVRRCVAVTVAMCAWLLPIAARPAVAVNEDGTLLWMSPQQGGPGAPSDDLAEAPDGRLVTIGTLSAPIGDHFPREQAIASMLVTSPDGSYSDYQYPALAPFVAGVPTSPSSVVVRPDGSAVVAGSFNDGAHLLVALPRANAVRAIAAPRDTGVGRLHLLADGRVALLAPGLGGIQILKPDNTFDTVFGGRLDAFPLLVTSAAQSSPTSLAVTPNGRMLITVVTAFAQCSVVAFDSFGRPDPTFGVGGVADMGPADRCAIDSEPSGTFLVTTSSETTGTIRRYTANGSQLPDPSLNPIAADLRNNDAVAVDGTGRIYVARGTELDAFFPSGEPDPRFGNRGVQTATGALAVRILSTGNLVTFGDRTLTMYSGDKGIAPQPPAAHSTKFVPLTPTRVLDTRIGVGAAAALVGPDGSIDVHVAPEGGVPADATAVAINVAAVDAVAPGFVTVSPSDSPRPLASSLNVDVVGETVANLVVVPIGPNGSIAIYSQSAANFIADVEGYFVASEQSADGRFVAASTPSRLADTRIGLGTPRQRVPTSGTVSVRATGAGGVPTTGVAAVAITLTVADPSGAGHLAAWPTGDVRPTASAVNFTAGQARSNLVIVPIGVDGNISVFSSVDADVVVDVAGWFTDGSASPSTTGLFMPTLPTRVHDTRLSGTPLSPATPTAIALAGSSVIPPPSRSSAVLVVATATDGSAPGYLTMWPAGKPQPATSSLNVSRPGQTIAESALIGLHDGAIDALAQSGTDLVLDVAGYFLV